MTEERIKELARTFWDDWLPARKSTALEGLQLLIRTVAAEARKEGIDEMRDAVISNENPILLLWDEQCIEVEAIAEQLRE